MNAPGNAPRLRNVFSSPNSSRDGTTSSSGWWKFAAGLAIGALFAAVAIFQVDPGGSDDGQVIANADDYLYLDDPLVDDEGVVEDSAQAGTRRVQRRGGPAGGGGPGGAGPQGGPGEIAGGPGGPGEGPGGGGLGDGPGGAGGGLQCAAGSNGGSTDKGVTGDKIRLAANVVTEGPGANFLADSPVGMEAVVRRVNNREGGICGRTLELKTVNDSWDAARGRRNIEDFIAEDYFALPVMPSSEGLSAAIDAGLIQNAGIPVVGADGMRKEQYDAGSKAAWVWPVATATVAQVRIMAKVARARGAETFGIVYDRKYKFGVEGADALATYLKTLPGATLKKRLPIEPGQNAYPSEANEFKGSCNPCDAVILLLEPITGVNWMTSVGKSGKGRLLTSGAQPLFNENFARNCKDLCDGVWVWTGYNPAIGTNVNQADIARYMSDVRAVNPSIDVTNQFLQGAYLGMEVFVDALKKCSPNLTRTCVQETMDSMDYTSGHTAPLRWRPGQHFANSAARGYSITYTQGSFSGFREETSFESDPTPGAIPS